MPAEYYELRHLISREILLKGKAFEALELPFLDRLRG